MGYSDRSKNTLVMSDLAAAPIQLVHPGYLCMCFAQDLNVSCAGLHACLWGTGSSGAHYFQCFGPFKE